MSSYRILILHLNISVGRSHHTSAYHEDTKTKFGDQVNRAAIAHKGTALPVTEEAVSYVDEWLMKTTRPILKKHLKVGNTHIGNL